MSMNEELITVNNQLQDKVEELDKTNNDMVNLFNSTNIASLLLDTELCIRQFTPATGRLLGLTARDVGRSISMFASEFTGDDLLDDARQVLEIPDPLEKEIAAGNERHYLCNIVPYRTADNHIEGVVITYFDISERIQAESKSRRLATVLRDSNDAVTVYDLDGNITAWNRGAERLYGYSEAEALQMNIHELVPAEKQTEFNEFMHQIGNTEPVESFDTRRQTRDGRILDVWLTITPLVDETGRITAVATTERDVSERRHMADIRIHSERLLHMVENLPAGAIFIEDGQLQMNRAAEQITGYQRDELATVDQWFDKLYGERAGEIRRWYDSDREQGFPVQTTPISITRKDGKQRFVEFVAYRFDDHEVWMMQDVTSRHQYETELHDREERLRAIMDHASEAVVVIDRSGVITDFNLASQKLFGYTGTEIIGQNVSKLMISPYQEKHDEYIARYHETGETWIMEKPRELPGRHKDGSVIPLQVTVTEVGHLGIYIGLIRDLTESKALKKEIVDISTLEQERIGQEIHDSLGQQLTGVNMLMSSLKRNLVNEKFPNAEKADEIILQLQKAIKIARSLSLGLAPVPLSPMGLGDALRTLTNDICNTTEVHCHYKTMQEVEISDHTVAIQLYRIAQESIHNAIKHAQPKDIIINLTNDDRYELTVSDNGKGFEVDKVMDTGLGLRLMRYRASIAGCKLEIESGPDEGTVVRCTQQ